MAPYLVGMGIGEFDVRAYRQAGIRYWDAIDPDLFTPLSPRTGQQYAVSQAADLSYKRLTHTISVPAEGAQLSFWITRDTNSNWDFAFVEVHSRDRDDGPRCPTKRARTNPRHWILLSVRLQLHPFLGALSDR